MSRIVKHPAIALLDSGTMFKEVRQIHAKLLVDGTLNDDHLVGQFVKAVALSNHKYLDYANQILDRSDKPTLFALNSMIRAHCKSPVPEKSFDFYRRILCSGNGLKPDNYTVNFLVQACTGLGLRETGLQAGLEPPDEVGGLRVRMLTFGVSDVSYKPQQKTWEMDCTVRQLPGMRRLLTDVLPEFESDVMKPLRIEQLLDRKVPSLSRGETERVAITLCLGRVRSI